MPGAVGTGNRHSVSQRARATGSLERLAARKHVRHAAALGGALHAAVTADRHEAAVRAAEHAARQGQIDDRRDVLHAEAVLRQAHAPHEDGAPGRG